MIRTKLRVAEALAAVYNECAGLNETDLAKARMLKGQDEQFFPIEEPFDDTIMTTDID